MNFIHKDTNSLTLLKRKQTLSLGANCDNDGIIRIGTIKMNRISKIQRTQYRIIYLHDLYFTLAGILHHLFRVKLGSLLSGVAGGGVGDKTTPK